MSLLLRLWPQSYPAQVVRRWQVSVDGEPVRPSSARTAFGEQQALWSRSVGSGEVEIVAEGVVETEDHAGVVKLPSIRDHGEVFLRSTELTRADKAIRELADTPEPGKELRWLHDLMKQVQNAISYESNATTSSTTAAAALKLGRGVCQDMAHIFVAAARAHGIPARYVTGYQLHEAAGHEGNAPHAWAEAWMERIGWIGFDPTTDLCPTERYVRLTAGLDALDAAPIRGHAIGGLGSGVRADVAVGIAAPGANTGRAQGQSQGQGQRQQ